MDVWGDGWGHLSPLLTIPANIRLIDRSVTCPLSYNNATAIIGICHYFHLQDFENSMKMWEYKHTEIQAASQPQLDSKESQYSLSDEEYAQMQHLAQLAENLISR